MSQGAVLSNTKLKRAIRLRKLNGGVADEQSIRADFFGARAKSRAGWVRAVAEPVVAETVVAAHVVDDSSDSGEEEDAHWATVGQGASILPCIIRLKMQRLCPVSEAIRMEANDTREYF